LGLPSEVDSTVGSEAQLVEGRCKPNVQTCQTKCEGEQVVQIKHIMAHKLSYGKLEK